MKFNDMVKSIRLQKNAILSEDIYYEVRTLRDFFSYLPEDSDMDDDDTHVVILYKDGTRWDNFDNPSTPPKKRNIVSAYVSNPYGIVLYNASPYIEEDDEEQYYYAELNLV